MKGAKQLRWDDKMGSLEAGKKANFIVIDKDPCKISPDKLSEIKVEAVIFDGKLVKGEL